MSDTSLVTLALFGRRDLAEDALGLTLAKELLDVNPLFKVDSFAFGPDFKRERFTRDQVTRLERELTTRAQPYAMHLWDEKSQASGSPTFVIRIAGRRDGFHHLMIDVPASWFRTVGDDLVRLSKQWLSKMELISGYMHDADDFYFQNEKNPETFRLSGRSLRGYRLKSIFRTLRREIDVERNPGHSHFIDGRMFTVAWLTYFGPDMIATYGRERIESATWQELTSVDSCLVGRLYDDPFEPERREKRTKQARVRAQLYVDEIAHSMLPKGTGMVERMEVDFRRP